MWSKVDEMKIASIHYTKKYEAEIRFTKGFLESDYFKGVIKADVLLDIMHESRANYDNALIEWSNESAQQTD